MASSFTVRLPWPPSVNHYWGNRIVHTGHRRAFIQTYIGARGKEFREAVELVIRDRFGGIPSPLTERLHVTILATMPDRRERDLDNISKGILDALTHVRLWDDDSQIDHIEVIRGGIKAPGYVDVCVRLAEKQPDEQRVLFQGSENQS
jgi:crossover junction endodeoxyribonuclease RusA